jgi:hypothetical protein
MNSVVGSPVPSADVISRATTSEVSLFRLYTLRASYLVLTAGLGAYIWPVVIHHTNELAATDGAKFALLAGLGATAVLGLRYPVEMLPLLRFELIWKANLSRGLCAATMVRPPDKCGGRRYKSLPDGCY